jgi:hypothetical protein
VIKNPSSRNQLSYNSRDASATDAVPTMAMEYGTNVIESSRSTCRTQLHPMLLPQLRQR